MKRLLSTGWILVFVALMTTGVFADPKINPKADCDDCLKTSIDGTLDVNWTGTPADVNSLRDEELAYHDGIFEGQIGNSNFGFGVRFSADAAIYLTGLTIYTLGDASATGAVVSVYADPGASIAGPPEAPIGPGHASALWESSPMDLTSPDDSLHMFDIPLENLAINGGDFYVVVWEDGTGFLGIANDLQMNYTDRNWVFVEDWATLETFTAGNELYTGNLGITATYLPQEIEGSFMTVAPQNIDFGILQLDDESISQNVTIANIGTEAFDITAVDIEGLGFNTSLALPATVAAGSSIDMDVTLTLTVEGPAEGTFLLTSTADNTTSITITASAMVYDGLPEYLIWNPSASISGEVFLNQLDALGHSATLTTDIFLFGDPVDVGYSGIFICLGMYDNDNYILNEGDIEVMALVEYAEAGFPLYMEGGNTWAANTQTTLHAYFGINGVSDGGDDLFNVDGANLMEGMDYTYNGFNVDVNHLEPATNDGMVFHINPTEDYACGIGHLTPGANTIGNSFEFGGLVGDDTPVSELLAAYLDFMAAPYTDIWSPSVAGVTRFTFTLDTVGPYTIEALATDNVGVDEIYLYYSLNGGEFFPVMMTDMGHDLYHGDIPGQEAGTSITYYVSAFDEAGNEGSAPADAPEEVYLFDVVSHLPPVYLTAESGLDGRVNLLWAEPGTEAPALIECADFPIPSLPFSATGSNAGMGDDFDVSGGDGEDVAYQLWMPEDGVIDITLCSELTDYDCKVEIFTEECTVSTGWYDDDGPFGSCDQSPAPFTPSELVNIPLEAGVYVIVVDGFNGAVGNYELFVSESEVARAPSQSFASGLAEELAKIEELGLRVRPEALSSSPREYYSLRELRELINYGIYHNTTSPVLIEAENLVEVIDMDSLTYTHFPVENEISHFYRVLAMYDDGESPSEQVEAIPTNHPPMTPMGLMGSVDDETNTITLSWEENTDYDIAGYNVYRGGLLAEFVEDPFYSEVAEDGVYHFSLKAVDAGGMLSGLSGTYSVQVGEDPPTYVTAVSGLDGTVELAWFPPGTERMLVEIEILTDMYANETSWDIADVNGAIVAEYSAGDLVDNTIYNWEVELPPENYTFTIYDSFGDGIYDPGYYTLTVNDQLIMTGGGGEGFDESESVVFGPEGALALRRGHFDDVAQGPRGSAPTNLAELNVITETLFDNTTPTRELRELANYAVYRSTESPIVLDQDHLVATLAPDVLAYTDFPLANAITYYYKIASIYDEGEGMGASEEVSAIPENHAPLAPQNVVNAVDVETSEVTVSWDDNSDYDLASYNVYRDDVLIGNVTEATFSEIVEDGAYRYNIRAVDTGDMESPSSMFTIALVGEVPPSYPTALSGLDGRIDLAWRVPGTELIFLNVEILTDWGGASLSWDITDGDGNFVAGVGPATMENNTLYNWEFELFPGTYTFTIYDEWSGGIYDPGYYTVHMNNSVLMTGNNFEASESVTFDTGGILALRHGHYDGVPTGPEGASPANLSSLNIIYETIYENTSTRELRDLTGYGVYRSTASPVLIEAENLVESVGADIRAYTDFPLTNGTTYYYKITATYDTGSAASVEVSGIPVNHEPTEPIDLAATVNNTTNTVTLTWTETGDYDLAGYNVYRNEVLLGTAPTALTATYDDVVDDGDYYYVVSSYDTGGMESSLSERIQVLVGEVPPTNLTADGNFDDHIELIWRTPGNPMPPLQDCGDELIEEIPFVMTGTNVGMGDDFALTGSNNEDYAYQLYMSEAGAIDITLCSPVTNYDTKVAIFGEDCTTEIYYNDDNWECDLSGLYSGIFGAELEEGIYFVVVDGYSANAGDYEITITEAATNRQFVPEPPQYAIQKMVNLGEISAEEGQVLVVDMPEMVEFVPQFVEMSEEVRNMREVEEISHYAIYRDNEAVGTTAETYYSDLVPENTAFTYTVTAVYSNGEESSATNEATATANMAPGPLDEFTVTMTGLWNVTFNWVDSPLNMDGSPCIDLDGIKVKRNGIEVATIDPGDLTYMDIGIPEGANTYEFIPRDEVPNIGESIIITVYGGQPPLEWDFEDGMLPPDWTQTLPEPAVPWTVGYAGDISNWAFTIPDNGSLIVGINDGLSSTGNGNNYLITGVLDFSYSDNAELVFESFYDDAEGSATVEYRVGTTGRWSPLEVLDPSMDWEDISIDLSLLEGIPNVYLGFHYNDNGTWAAGWAMDNVMIVGYETIMMGDMNADGELDIYDIVRFIEIMTFTGDEPTLDEEGRMDLNGDGAYNILDVVIMIETALLQPGLAKEDPITETLTAVVPATILSNTREWQSIPVAVDFSGLISGFQADLVFDPAVVELGVPELSSENADIGVFTAVTGNTMRVLAIDLGGSQIDLSSGLLMNVPIQVIDENASGATGFDVEELILSGVGGVEIQCECLVSAIDIGLPAPTEFSLLQNYPNPFNPTTNIRYDIAETADANLVIYNMLGQQVRTLVSSRQDAGRYEVMWNGLNDAGQPVATGIYIYHLQAGHYSKTIKMAYIK